MYFHPGTGPRLARWRRGLPAARLALLAGAVVAAVCVTVPEQRARLGPLLWGFNALLALECLWHLLATGGKPRLGASGGFLLASVLAAPLLFALGVPADHAWPLAAFVWLLRLVPASPGLVHLARVFIAEAEALRSLLVLFLLMLVGCAVGLRLAEAMIQPEAAGSLPAALWWVLASMITDSFPEGAAPQTAAGRVIGTVVLLFSLGLFGLLTGILATGFAREGERHGFLQARDLIARVPFLCLLPPQVVAELARALRRWDLPADRVIFRRGRPGESMYFIATGAVEVKLPEGPVRLRQGALFGEMAILNAGTRNATVTTLQPSTLLVLDVVDYLRLAARHPQLAEAVAAEAARRGVANERAPRIAAVA